jgi:hypothetical protein
MKAHELIQINTMRFITLQPTVYMLDLFYCFANHLINVSSVYDDGDDNADVNDGR